MQEQGQVQRQDGRRSVSEKTGRQTDRQTERLDLDYCYHGEIQPRRHFGIDDSDGMQIRAVTISDFHFMIIVVKRNHVLCCRLGQVTLEK